MGLYPFGYLFIGVLCFTIIRTKNILKLFKKFIFIELVFACARMNYGYLFRLGGNEIEYNDILLGVLLVLSIYVLLRTGMNLKMFNISFMLLAVIGIGIVRCYMFPANVLVLDYNHSWDWYFRGDSSQLTAVHFSGQSILMFIRVLIVVFILNAARRIITGKEWINIGIKVKNVMHIIIIYGVLEIILKFVFNMELNHYLNLFFGRGVSTGGGITRLQGLCREPSYYALGLFNFVILSLLLNKLLGKKNIVDIWMILAIFIGCLSTSFSFFICIVAVILLWNILSDNVLKSNIRVKRIFILVSCTILIITVLFNQRFLAFAGASPINVLNRTAEAVVQIKNGLSGMFILGRDYSSEASRLIGGILSFKAGMNCPLFGLGLGTVYCVTGLIAIFANIGICGLLLWIVMLFRVYIKPIGWELICIVLLPVLFCNDLYTLYDTSYLLILPLLSMCVNNNIGEQINEHK